MSGLATEQVIFVVSGILALTNRIRLAVQNGEEDGLSDLVSQRGAMLDELAPLLAPFGPGSPERLPGDIGRLVAELFEANRKTEELIVERLGTLRAELERLADGKRQVLAYREAASPLPSCAFVDRLG